MIKHEDEELINTLIKHAISDNFSVIKKTLGIIEHILENYTF